MTLLPRSLFGRLALVLFVGLLAAQGLSAWLLLEERVERLYHASGLGRAERIADLVALLEDADAAERRRLVDLFDTPGLRVALLAEPLEVPEGTGPAAERARAFRGMLTRALGDDRAVAVAVGEGAGWAPMHGPGEGRRWGAGHPGRGWRHMHDTGVLAPSGATFLAQVRLGDGAWLVVQSRAPEALFAGSTRMLMILAVLLVTVVLLTLLAVRWVTRPLAGLAAAAEQLGRDIHRPPLAETGPAEVVNAARAFNTMQARIGRFVEDRTRILTAVSHDLKTPVTRLRLRAELLEDERLRESFVRDLDELAAMTAATLDFLRGIGGDEALAPVDLTALLESLREDAVATGREVTIAGSPRTPYTGRPLALKRCLSNLIENALVYGGGARVSIRDARAVLELTVSDDGPGIPEPALEQVFEPFYRLEASRSRDTGGTGLGLGIARSIARSHGGDVVLRNRAGGGLDAVLTLAR